MFYLFAFVVATSRILYFVSNYLYFTKDPEKYPLADRIGNITTFTAFYGEAVLGVF